MIVFACLVSFFLGLILGGLACARGDMPKAPGGFGETPAGWTLPGQSPATATYRVDPSTAHDPLYFDLDPIPAWTGEPTEYRFSWPEVKT